MRKIGIIDYGSGNIGSIVQAVILTENDPIVVSSESSLASTSLLVLPGVGSAVYSISRLRDSGLWTVIENWKDAGKPIIGLCLGAQLFCEYLEESGSDGFGWFPASATKIEGGSGFNNGWQNLDYAELESLNLANDIDPNATFYFNHQFRIDASRLGQKVTIGDEPNTAAIVLKGAICGVQFHPEKSQLQGVQVLKNILEKLYAI